MKTFRLLTILAVLGLTILTACSKKKDDVNPDPAGGGAAGFRVKVDGKEYAKFRFTFTVNELKPTSRITNYI